MRLGVNVDHIATIREARGEDLPDPVLAAKICEKSGCDSIVCHLRIDRRHINDTDLVSLRENTKTKLNLEMSCAEEIVKIALKIVPDQATIVPERREELTTEGGLDVITHQKQIKKIIQRLMNKGIGVSLFIDPEKAQIQAAKDIGVRCIELHTGRYANAKNKDSLETELHTLITSAKFAHNLKLQVFAGHGLNYTNVKRIAKIPEIEELNIGHSIVSEAIFTGMENAVKKMIGLINL